MLLVLAAFYPAKAMAQAPAMPQSLRLQLQGLQEKDDLSGWIYEQLQWVAKAPGARAEQLSLAVDKAWRRPRTGEENQAWQDLLANEGYSFLLSGAIVPSTDAYTAAYEWMQHHPEIADAGYLLENILKPLGNNYTRLGDYEQALFIQQKALAIALDGKDREGLAGAYSNLANTSSNMGRPLQARQYCREGLRVADEHSGIAGLLYSEQADAFQQLHQQGEARISIGKSLAVLEQATGRQHDAVIGYWLLMAYQQAGDLYGDEPAKALGYYQKALSLQHQLSPHQGDRRERDQAKLFQRLSVLYFRLHQDKLSLYWSDQCLTILAPGKKIDSLRPADLYGENTLADLLYTRAGLAKRAGATDEAIRLYTLCFDAEKKLRQSFITGSSRELSITDSRSQYEEALGTAWEAWERTRNTRFQKAMLYFIESSKAQLLLDEMAQQRWFGRAAGNRQDDSLESRIRLLEAARIYYSKKALESSPDDSMARVNAGQKQQIDWELAQLRKKTGLRNQDRMGFPPDSLGQLFGAGEAGREFFATDSALYVVECTHDGISFTDKQPMPSHWEDSLRDFIGRWYQQGANAMIDHPQRYYRQAYAVYRMLFGPHPFQAGREYIVFPDGAFSLLPIEALVTAADAPASPADWPFVIRQTLLSYGWSLQTLWEQRERTGTGSGFSGFFLSGNRGAPVLKAVDAEEEGIKQAIRTGNWYTDTQATKTHFREALETSAIVHISSHAFTRTGSIDAPHIQLSDDAFYIFELQGLARHPALVVLSACRTGDGRMVTGEGVQSLARAFTAGGADAVVAGWWNLNDETTAQLMSRYYSVLEADNGKNAAAALRAAKLQWLSDASVPYLHKLPYFWSGLGYLGDPTPLSKNSLKKEQGPSMWPLFLLSIVILLTISVYVRVRRGYNPG